MRRADRLFRVVQMLRSGRLLTGAQLAERLEISVRTLYRDIADLQSTGVLIEGEPGVGYTLRRDMDLPPMQFTAEETTALVLGIRMVAAWGGEAAGIAAVEALRKIEAVLPATMRQHVDAVQMYAPPFVLAPEFRRLLDTLHNACIHTRVVRFSYLSLENRASTRRVRPLALAFWGDVWTLVAWCETRNDFRNFRADRLSAVDVLETFTPRRGQHLKDFLRTIKPANRPPGAQAGKRRAAKRVSPQSG